MAKIAEHTTGHRTIAGTEWPVQNIAYQDGPREYTVAFGVCNGTADSSTVYRTKREALAALTRGW